MRLCANTGCILHLIEPLGFSLDNARLCRAGLDYREFVTVQVHANLDDWWAAHADTRIFAFSAKARRRYDSISWQTGDALLFGPEARGLPASVLGQIVAQRRLYIPMHPDRRSLNLANAVAIAVYRAWGALDFVGAAGPRCASDG